PSLKGGIMGARVRARSVSEGLVSLAHAAGSDRRAPGRRFPANSLPCRLPRPSPRCIICSYQNLFRSLSGVRMSHMTRTPMRLIVACVAAALALALSASRSDAAEVKLARHPDYHNGKIVFS